MMSGRREEIGRYCPNCGAVITYGEYFCRACHTRLPNPNDLQASGTVKPETYIVPARRWWVSLLLSCGFSGLGQLYNGDTLRGVGFGIAYLIISFGYFGGQYHNVLLLGIWIAALAEALISAMRINSYTRNFKGTSLLLWIGLAGFGSIILMHFYTGLPDTQYLEKIFPLAYYL